MNVFWIFLSLSCNNISQYYYFDCIFNAFFCLEEWHVHLIATSNAEWQKNNHKEQAADMMTDTSTRLSDSDGGHRFSEGW